jgi:hypothetical protein
MPVNSRESSIRTCQMGPNRWNHSGWQSPRAWACVSCVSEVMLPASDPHLYGFQVEGNGSAVEKRSDLRDSDFLSDGLGAHKWCQWNTGTDSGPVTRQVPLELWPKFCGSPSESAVPTIIGVLKQES